MEPIQNEGSLDRAARGLFALVFLTLGIAKSRSLVGKLFIGLGILLGVTAATGTWPGLVRPSRAGASWRRASENTMREAPYRLAFSAESRAIKTSRPGRAGKSSLNRG